jgi:Tol biopolymer transport system component
MDGPILRLTIGLVLVVLLGGGALLYRSVQHRVDTPASADGAEVVDASLALSGRPLTYDEAEDRLSAQAISPSGTYLVYSDRAGLTLATLATGELRLLNVPSRIKISRISWYPDESAVLIAETAADGPVAGALHDDRSGVGSAESQSPSIWRVPLNGLPGIPLLDNAQQAEVSPDNRRLAYTSGGGDAVWIADANGRSPHKLISAADGETFRGVLWSATGRAVLADRHYKRPPQLAGSDLATGPSDSARRGDDRSFYESYDPESGALLARREDVSFDSATMTHDGALIFPINSATEPSSVAIVQTDKSTGAWLGRPRLVRAQRAFRITASLIAQLSASADGKALSALIDRSTTSVFTANLTETPGQPPRLEHEERLTHHTGTTYPTAWTPDSSAVIFDDGIGGPISIAAQAPGSAGQRVLAAARSPVEKFAQARVSPDGRWLLFLNLDRDSSQLNAIERVPLGGGLPQVVPTNGQVKDFRCSTSPAGRCVVREVEGRSALIYYQLDPVRGMGAELARTAWQPNVLGDWSISPDGTTVARADHDRQHPAIERVPLAESASGQRKSAAVRQIPVTGFGTVLAPNWSPDGHSFFVETYTDPTYNLLSVKLDGQATLLRRSPQLIWAIPSPDGKKIAFPGVTLNDRNVWLATIDLGRVRP